MKVHVTPRTMFIDHTIRTKTNLHGKGDDELFDVVTSKMRHNRERKLEKKTEREWICLEKNQELISAFCAFVFLL